MTTTERKTEEERSKELDALGFALRIESGPAPGVDDDWPHIAYVVSLMLNGKVVLNTPYKMGVGHVKWPKTFEQIPRGGDVPVFNTLRHNPGAQLKNKLEHATAAALLARLQKVTPSLCDVMHSLITDGEAFFNAQSFEDWASDFGYDSDSRSAEAIYRACDSIGRKLAQGIPKGTLDKVREILADY